MRHFASGCGAIKISFSFFRKTHNTFFESKEGVVFAETNIGSGKDSRTALAHNDSARESFFSGIKFCAEILWIGIS